MAGEERNAGNPDVLTQLKLFSEEGRKAKGCLSLADPSQDGSQVAELKSALEAKKLELKTILRRATEHSTLRLKSDCLRVPSRR